MVYHILKTILLSRHSSGTYKQLKLGNWLLDTLYSTKIEEESAGNVARDDLEDVNIDGG